jgi:spore maturation protein CgeB
MKSRILICGHAGRASIERCWIDWLHANSFDAHIFDPHPLISAATHSSLVERALWRVSPYTLANLITEPLVQAICALQPNLLLVVSGNLVTKEAIARIRVNAEAPIVHFFNEDFFNPRNTSVVLRDAAASYDKFFTTKSFNVPELARLGIANVAYLPHGYRPRCHFPVSVTAQESQRYGSPVTFVGTYERPRANVLKQLGTTDLKIWGNNWNRLPIFSPLRRAVQNKDVYCEEMSKVFNSSHICLAFLRRANRDRHTSRTFEIPACGGFQLAERSDEVLEFFDEGKEIECFGSAAELRDKVDFYLRNECARVRIASAGMARLRRSRYSFTDRLESILASVA